MGPLCNFQNILHIFVVLLFSFLFLLWPHWSDRQLYLTTCRVWECPIRSPISPVSLGNLKGLWFLLRPVTGASLCMVESVSCGLASAACVVGRCSLPDAGAQRCSAPRGWPTYLWSHTTQVLNTHQCNDEGNRKTNLT